MARLGIRIKTVSEESAERPVGELFGYEDINEADFLPSPANQDAGLHETAMTEDISMKEELLVLSGFDEASLDRLLRELKKAHASISLKSMLTETNFSWSFRKLYGEIVKERENMEK